MTPKVRPGVLCQDCLVRNKVEYKRVLGVAIAVPTAVASMLRGRYTYGDVFVADVRKVAGRYLCQHCRKGE